MGCFAADVIPLGIPPGVPEGSLSPWPPSIPLVVRLHSPATLSSSFSAVVTRTVVRGSTGLTAQNELVEINIEEETIGGIPPPPQVSPSSPAPSSGPKLPGPGLHDDEEGGSTRIRPKPVSHTGPCR